MMTGEYFLSEKAKEGKEREKKREEKEAKKKEKIETKNRQFIAPEEKIEEPVVEEQKE